MRWVIAPNKKGRERFKGLFRSQLYEASAQYGVAGSYGPFHATTGAWDNTDRLPFLDRSGFVLKDEGVCLTDLRPTGSTLVHQEGPVALAARVAVAHHAHAMTTPKAQYVCESTPCDQVDLARTWSLVFSRYNPEQALSYMIGSGKLLDSKRKTNWIGERAVLQYDVNKPPKGR